MLPLRLTPLMLLLSAFAFSASFAPLAPTALAGGVNPKRIDLKKTWFGVEYTFQDEEMVNESGRATFETPHKRERFEVLKQAYADVLGIENTARDIGDGDYKPGADFQVPKDGKHVLTMEPVTIEMNTPPRTFWEIEPTAAKIFSAAGKANLVPYVNPAAERSGMGHIHVGAKAMKDNPFYKHPNLLRNIMVHMHQHPSLMWGFAEAYDIGGASNITTLHNYNPRLEKTAEDHLLQYDPEYLPDVREGSNLRRGPAMEQEQAFFRAVDKFDKWYAKALKQGDTSDGLRQFLRALRAEGLDSSFYHYGMINLEHLEWLAKRRTPLPKDYVHNKKATVEFRQFRPPASPGHARAHAGLLVTLMDDLSEPGKMVPTRSISAEEYNRFHSASVVADDWNEVKRGLSAYDPLWDDSVKEYVDVQLKTEAVRLKFDYIKNAEVRPAYSPKYRKGTKFELRIPENEIDGDPKVSFDGKELEFEKVKLGNKSYWVTVFDAQHEGTGSRFLPSMIPSLARPAECAKWFEATEFE